MPSSSRTPNHSNEVDDHLCVTKDVYSVTDNQIHRQQIYQSGATAVTLVLDRKNKYMCVANAGITHAVLCRKSKAIRLTKDHTAEDAEEAAMGSTGCWRWCWTSHRFPHY